MPAPEARLLGLSTASPPFTVDQKTAIEVAETMFKGRLSRAFDLPTLFGNTGIRARHTARPLDWYLEPRDWPQRNAAYLEAAEALYLQTAQGALAASGLDAADIGGVVTISSTGVATPSLDARVHGRLGLRPGVRRTPVFGLGCAGGVSGLALAARLARADPGRPILLVVVELCSLAYRPDDASMASVVATALFGDGAAAAVVLADGAQTGRAFTGQGERLWPDTLDIMGWRIDPQGFGIVLAATLPAFIGKRLPAAVEEVLAETGIDRAAIDRFVCHPGGARVLDALETSLGLAAGGLDHERAVMADHGNMSAPTVLFVLERVLAAGAHPGPLVLAALGPGFTASFLGLGPDRG